MDEFHYFSHAQEVIFGAGSLTRLSQAVERFGWQRFMLCANRSVRAGGYTAKVEAMLGDRLVAVFGEVQPHVQDQQVDEALALAVEKGIDAVIGMGGGSSIGMAKAVAYRLEEERQQL